MRSASPLPGARFARAKAFASLSPAERVESLYLATLGRLPTTDEAKRALGHVERGEDAKARYADLLWALLNGVEFRTNH